jgi:outer membrane protein
MKKFAFIVIILAGTNSSFCQILTLQQAINIALKNSLDIQIQRNNVAISKINNNIGVAGGLPVITASASDIEQTTNVDQKLNSGTIIKRNGAVGNSYSSNVTAGILLYNGSRVVANKHRLEQLELQSDQNLNSQIQNTMASVMFDYYNIVRQQAYLAALEQSIAVARQQLNIVKTQQSVGMANNADLYQSQINLNSLVQQKQAQQLVIDQAKTGLLLLLNLKPDSLIDIKDTIIIDHSLALGDVLNNLNRNPDIIAAEKQMNINEYIEKQIASLRYPSVGATAGYNFNRSQTTAGNVLLNRSIGPFVGISIGIPIYDGTSYKRQQKVAEINVVNASLARDSLFNAYAAHAVQTYQAYTASLEQLDSQKINLQIAQKLVNIVLERFQLHAATIIDLMQAEQSYQNASFTYIDLSYAAKSSEIELNRLINQIKF